MLFILQIALGVCVGLWLFRTILSSRRPRFPRWMRRGEVLWIAGTALLYLVVSVVVYPDGDTPWFIGVAISGGVWLSVFAGQRLWSH